MNGSILQIICGFFSRHDLKKSFENDLSFEEIIEDDEQDEDDDDDDDNNVLLVLLPVAREEEEENEQVEIGDLEERGNGEIGACEIITSLS